MLEKGSEKVFENGGEDKECLKKETTNKVFQKKNRKRKQKKNKRVFEKQSGTLRPGLHVFNWPLRG